MKPTWPVWITASSLTVLTAPMALAMGLGEIKLYSNLGQSFHAEVPIMMQADEMDLSELTADFGQAVTYAQMGISRSPMVDELRVSVSQKAGKPVLMLQSEAPIDFPFLTFLLDLKTPKGNLIREYTVLLDPPALRPATQPTSDTLTQAPARPAPAKTYGPIKSNEGLWDVAKQIRGDRQYTIPQVELALQAKNPDAFIRGNINGLKKGVTLVIPTDEEIGVRSAGEAYKLAQVHNIAWRAKTSVQAELDQGSVAQTLQAAIETMDIEAVQKTVPPAISPAAPKPAGSKSIGSAQTVFAQHTDIEASNTDFESLRSELRRALDTVNSFKTENEALVTQNATLSAENKTLQQIVDQTNSELKNLESQTDTRSLMTETETFTATPRAVTGGQISEIDLQGTDAKPMLMGAGLLALLFGVGGWFSYRYFRRKALIDEDIRIESLGEKTATRVLPEADEQVDEIEVTASAEVVSTDAHEISSEMAYTQASATESDADATVDPLDSADVYLKYERYDSAANVCLQALEQDPSAAHIITKLFDIYEASGDVDQCRAFFETISPDVIAAHPALAERIAAFSESQIETQAITDETVTEADSVFADDTVEQTSLASESIAMTSESGLSITEESAADVISFENSLDTVEAHTSDEPSEVFDAPALAFETTASATETQTEAVIETEQAETNIEAATETSVEPALAFDVDVSDLSLTDTDNDAPSSEIETLDVPEENQENTTPEPSETVQNNLCKTDETKLDLAKAYLELGDTVSAKQLLDEICESDNPNTREEALAILAQLTPTE